MTTMELAWTQSAATITKSAPRIASKVYMFSFSHKLNKWNWNSLYFCKSDWWKREDIYINICSLPDIWMNSRIYSNNRVNEFLRMNLFLPDFWVNSRIYSNNRVNELLRINLLYPPFFRQISAKVNQIKSIKMSAIDEVSHWDNKFAKIVENR